MDWAKVINGMSLAGETMSSTASLLAPSTPSPTAATLGLNPGDRGTEPSGAAAGTLGLAPGTANSDALALISDYAGFAEIYLIYLNTFYCLAIICLVSVFDR